ncbi:MAG TPA: HAD family phosphatase [Flavobacteriales bacterium]|jgi:putative hydrolase of the HAD superfamily|nr:HAD family phosphatase [Flavobacteriales bacterium]
MIDTLILDLGGVLIDVDYHRTARAFHALGFERFEELYSKAQQDHLFDGFEVGALTPAQFRDRIRTLHRMDMTDREIDACWNAMLGSIAPERLALVQRLREHYTVLLLSNTNAIHVPAFEAIIAKENGVHDFASLFDGAYYSCHIGLRKPHAEAFHHVLAKHDRDASRSLFIDDSIQHVHGARVAGLRAEHLELVNEDVIALVERLQLIRT